ncbi:MAG: S-ribosylhomocysteine lyase [Lactobacillus helveticus]|uniref:S-ribosylhomocysteine lyase n=3 Tax=Lactobacillus helveticus TaxID=1587 RepID=LUXS_LACH4|nr:S-ribosylhomocysteine lyase [Lactobacillus helveticus]A8YXQ1.1 RecName: Full=S-ribosylhomocysteine lyase; AltName: Full=AI-2 synthesis protein; AltName: Full=Autoinducer-2 production protein LuxS [Lactobacillus helveticus DPC 4571]ABX27751.1 LuxS [Lactobacillus helveticus DPC 4571]AUI75078.1 S-ribosylhomocysteine lyase [Lactobacillus helveticus]AUI76972.1 S-ribosylhomocysteine lyase [Lactobacillus helveticus]AZA20616.1 MAG: S-ribosylhomocysteine lyase [Lactobacillus helveticus]MDY0991904.1
MAKVESFTLDHTKVKAPYVRLITEETGKKGDVISNYDLRLVQPNTNAIPTAGLHTIEHLLAGLLRDRLDGVIDCSPFGCRTGFHLITWGKHSTTEVAKALKGSLEAIANDIEWKDVQGTDKYSCGNYRDHSLFSAKEWSKEILSQGISDQPFERHVI